MPTVTVTPSSAVSPMTCCVDLYHGFLVCCFNLRVPGPQKKPRSEFGAFRILQVSISVLTHAEFREPGPWIWDCGWLGDPFREILVITGSKMGQRTPKLDLVRVPRRVLPLFPLIHLPPPILVSLDHCLGNLEAAALTPAAEGSWLCPPVLTSIPRAVHLTAKNEA